MTSETVTRYRFPGPDGSLWLGVRPAPLAALAAVVTVTVLVLYVGAPLPAALLVLTIGVAAALVPVGDRSAVEWAPAALRAAAAHVTGHARWRSGTVLQTVGPRSSSLRLPAPLGAQRVVSVGGLGIVEDGRAGIAVGVLAVAGTDRFALADPQEQSRLLDAWGSTLAALGADPRILRLQWLERAAPEDRDATEWMRQRADADAHLDAVADYARLVGEVAKQAVRHDVWLAVAVDGGAGVGTAADAVTDVAGRLVPAGLVGRAVCAEELPELLRRGIDGPQPGVARVHRLGPASLVQGWDHVRTDDCWHRSFAVTGWPRLPLTAGWLEPLLLAAPPNAARTVSVHLQPVAAGEAMRRARAAHSRAQLDAVDRNRLGLLDSARVEADAVDAAAAEEELVAGYRLHRLSAAVTVSAPSAATLGEASRAVRTAAETARLELRPLHGQHLAGLRAALPLCRSDGRVR